MTEKIYGFTGSREGFAIKQVESLLEVLKQELPPPIAWHHGDCVGCDEDSHDIVRTLFKDCFISIWPGKERRYRAYCDGDKIHKPRDYLVRNRLIAERIALLIATPKSGEQKGGTWYTFRYARALSVPAIMIKPDGDIVHYGKFVH